MMVGCSAYNCKSRSERKEPGITFHRFPMKDPKRLALWVDKMHVKDWSPTKNDKLCSRHFDQNLFYTIGTRTCLLDDAVPTIFEESSKYIQEMPRTKQFFSTIMDEDSINNATTSESEECVQSGDETIQIQLLEQDESTARSLSPVEANNVSVKRKKPNSSTTDARKYLKGLNQKTLVARKRINTLINTVRMLQQHCNDLPINDEKLQALLMVNESDDDDTSSDEDDQNIRILEDVKDPIYQGHILDECNSTWANSVQVTLIGESGDRKIKSLEKKVEMAAERDVALSQELLLLKNQIFLKTKHIEDLKNDVTTLKVEAETHIFGP